MAYFRSMQSYRVWLYEQPRGTQTEMMRETRLSWRTIQRARAGLRVDYATAKRIRAYVREHGGDVDVISLCEGERG
jgi:hypothetical protein